MTATTHIDEVRDLCGTALLSLENEKSKNAIEHLKAAKYHLVLAIGTLEGLEE